MPLLTPAFRKALVKNSWVVLGVACLATAWLIEKRSVNKRQDEIDSKRVAWDQYRVDNSMYTLLTSKFETMRLIDIATSTLINDSSAKAQILLQLRAALFDQLRLRIEREEAVYLLEKDPIDDGVALRLRNKKVEVTNAYNSKDISRLYAIHEKENDESFNNTELRTKKYVRDFYDLLARQAKAESGYLVLYILGSILVVFQKIKDTIRQEKTNGTDQKPVIKTSGKK